jgi:hypothetical protein
MGIIYIYTFPNGKQYIGQTKNTLAQRTAKHVYEAKNTPNKGCISLNRAIVKYEGTFEKRVICEYTTINDANTLEVEHIKAHNSLVPNGYNIRLGGGNAKHNPESVSKRAKSLRKNKEDIDLPFFTKREVKRGTLRWRINNHPLCSNKNFDTKEEMLTFLLDLEEGKIPPIIGKPRKPKTTPDFIYERKNGYVIDYNGKMLASILDKNRPKDDLLEIAKIRVQELTTEGKIIPK